MSQRRVQLVILCEDRQQEVFARHFLEKRGFTGLFRTQICLKGSQSGEQYVRTQYPLEVKAYRQNKNRVSIGLVVLTDADTGTQQERLNQLAHILSEDLQQARQTVEAIAIFTPKRNIETWIHYLQSGEPIDEIVAYSKLTNQGECKPFVEKLADQCVQGLPANAPLSMHDACMELKRIIE